MTDKPWYMENYKQKFSARSTQRILPKVEAALAEEMAARNSKRDTLHFHPSELAKADWCPRSSWYKINGYEEVDSSYMGLRRMNILAEGNNIHDKWQRWMYQAGGLSGDWKCVECTHIWQDVSPKTCPKCMYTELEYREVPVSSDEFRIIGHADGVWQDAEGEAVVELKSVGLGTLRWEAPALYEGYEKGEMTLDGLWGAIKRPLLSHRKQVNLYMYLLGIPKSIVIYEWKPSQEVKEFQLSLDMDLVQPILDGVSEAKIAVETGVIPNRPTEAAYKGCSFCRFCSFKSECWSSK